MENKLGRKSMQDWQEMTDALTARVYKSGFNSGYDAAKDETPDVDDMAQLLIDKYNDEGLSNLMMIVDKIRPRRVKEFKTVKRKAEVGERVLVTDAIMNFILYGNGDVLKVSKVDRNCVNVGDCGTALWHSEYEVIIESEGHVSVKSPNQQRAELIQRAREFVEEHTKKQPADEYFDKPYIELPNVLETCVIEDFFVNTNKHAVTCLLRGVETNRIWFKGIAKCMPDEVFNADIGKAIALTRALNIDIPDEFIHAVQPDEKVVGMKIQRKYSGSREVYERTVKEIGETEVRYTCGGYDLTPDVLNDSIIVDDSNAQY